MDESFQGPKTTPDYIDVITEIFRFPNRGTEAGIAERLGLKEKFVSAVLEPLRGLVSYPDGKRPGPGPGRHEDTEETFVALCTDRLKKSKSFKQIEVQWLRRQLLQAQRGLQAEIEAWDKSLPPKNKWSYDNILEVFSLWQRGGSKALRISGALLLAKKLGHRHTSTMWYLGQFDFCSGVGTVWNVQDAAARIYSRGDEDAYLEIMIRVEEARNNSLEAK